MKRVDIVPYFLKQLPFNGLFRCSTEGGEHSHYLHQCLFYGHSSRGGGWVKEDPIVTIFKWYYRQIRQRISETSAENQRKFEAFVFNVYAEKGMEPPSRLNGSQTVTATPTSNQNMIMTAASNQNGTATPTSNQNVIVTPASNQNGTATPTSNQNVIVTPASYQNGTATPTSNCRLSVTATTSVIQPLSPRLPGQLVFLHKVAPF